MSCNKHLIFFQLFNELKLYFPIKFDLEKKYFQLNNSGEWRCAKCTILLSSSDSHNLIDWEAGIERETPTFPTGNMSTWNRHPCLLFMLLSEMKLTRGHCEPDSPSWESWFGWGNINLFSVFGWNCNMGIGCLEEVED